ncbi:MAG: proton-translocating transhydrogenase family protein [Pirellulaceae bacterium]
MLSRYFLIALGVCLCIGYASSCPAQTRQAAPDVKQANVPASKPADPPSDATAAPQRSTQPETASDTAPTDKTPTETSSSEPAERAARDNGSRAAMLVGSLTIFLLAIFVGFEVITKVPPTLHTPLMSGSNAISGITIVGAMLTAGHALGGFGSLLGFLAVVLAMVNVVGGFLVTHRMLMMFKKR